MVLDTNTKFEKERWTIQSISLAPSMCFPIDFFFETSHLDTVVASVRIQTHTYTTHTHTSHTPQVYNQTYNYTQISRRVLREITRVIEAPATGASQSLCGSTRWEAHLRLFREPTVPGCEIRVERRSNADGGRSTERTQPTELIQNSYTWDHCGFSIRKYILGAMDITVLFAWSPGENFAVPQWFVDHMLSDPLQMFTSILLILYCLNFLPW